MITNKVNIRNSFSLFHDGTICGFENYPEKLRLKVDCYYLSERINPQLQCFYIELYKPNDFHFEPWSDKDFPRKTITDLNLISQFEYNIFTCKIENGKYHLDVEIEEPKTALIGGTLSSDCEGIKIYDQSNNEMTFEQLSNLGHPHSS